MYQAFYSLPLALGRVMQKKEHPVCSVDQSVKQWLRLMMITTFGEATGDESFGCCIWNHEFDNLNSAHKLREFIRESILHAIQQYERRLCSVRIELSIRHEEKLGTASTRTIKKRMDITVSGLIRSTNEKFVYKDCFYIGPLSY